MSRTDSHSLSGSRQFVFRELCRLGLDSSEARRESQLIVEHVTGFDTAGQIRESERIMTEAESAALVEILEARFRRLPLQYILGHTWFMGARFNTLEGVFIPRSDTEVVVETTVALVKDRFGGSCQLFEVGTGSGAISISLLRALPDCVMRACDLSPQAVSLTDKNAQSLGVGSRLKLYQSDWLELTGIKVDGIVSNPPYIPVSDADSLAPEVLCEPHLALFGTGEDGLGFYRDFAAQSGRYFKGGVGFVALEIGDGQASAVSRLFGEHGWCDISTVKDLCGKARVFTAWLR